MQIDPGFDYKRILAVSVGPRWQPGKIEEGFAQAGPYLARMLEAVSRVPGVQASAAVSSVRAALGASRASIARGLLVESVVLSLGGAALGVLLAAVGVRAIGAWLPAGLPRVASIAIDMRVLAAAVAAALATGVGFGLAPALQSSRPNLSAALKDGGRSATAGAAGHRVRSVLVVSEVALAVVLVVGAGLFASSFAKLMRINLGFDYQRVLVVGVGLRVQPGRLDEAFAQGPAYVLRMLDAVRRVPGVEAGAVLVGASPLSGSWRNSTVTVPGRGKFEGIGEGIERRGVTPGYFDILRVPLLRGRHVTDDDRAGTQPVVVINQAAARKYWPDRDALGQRIVFGGAERVVVGIVANTRDFGPEAPARPMGFLPLPQDKILGGTLVLRTSGDPLKLLPAVKAAIWSVSKDQRVSGTVFTLEGYLERMITQRRFIMALLVLFGVLGLVISAAGIYGVMAYLVAQRTAEIGVRMALGATPGSVVGMVLRRAGVLMAIGLALGTGASWYLAAAVKSFLFQVEPTDPGVLAGSLAVLTMAGLAASVVPARRAASVDPLIALRRE